MPPITMLIKPVSGLCNMRCKYCFYADVSENRKIKSCGIMSLQTLQNLVRKALNYADGFCSFAFQGGEPILAGLDFYKKLLEFQRLYNHKNIRIHNAIQTNGYEISPEFAKFFAENNFLVGLSIDGTEAIHDRMRLDANGEGTFAKISKTAKLFDNHKVEYNILCVVNHFVSADPDRVYDALRRHKFIQFIPCIDSFDGIVRDYSLDTDMYANFLKRTFDRYYKDFKQGKHVSIRNFDNYIGIVMGRPPENCAMNGICSCYFLVEGDGSVFPCDFYVLDEWFLGNINKDSLARMSKSEVAHKFIESSKYVDPTCRECTWYALCRGGCRRDREPLTNGAAAAAGLTLNKYCAAYKAFFEYAIERMKEVGARLRT